MNHTVSINTDHSPARLELHKDFAGIIKNRDFCTSENRLKWIAYTEVERLNNPMIKKASYI